MGEPSRGDTIVGHDATPTVTDRRPLHAALARGVGYRRHVDVLVAVSVSPLANV